MLEEVYRILEEVWYNGRSMVMWEKFCMLRELCYVGRTVVY